MLALTNDNGPLPTELASSMMPVIRAIAARLARRLPSHLRLDDLTSAGYIGLVTAYRRFDRSRGDDFHAYAERRIRGAMLDELRAIDPLTRDLRLLANRIAATRRELESHFHRAAREEEVAAALGMPVEEFRRAVARVSVGPTVSIEEPSDGEGSIDLPDRDAQPVDERIAVEESRHAMHEAIAKLPPRLRHVVKLYYGEGRTLREIGAMLGVTESRVSQIQSEAVQRLRAMCAQNDTVRPNVARIEDARVAA
jgi:RNA polymerase sigma factor for flagellar operon FliA